MSWDSSIYCVYVWFILCHCCRIIQFLHIYIYLCILPLMTLGLFTIGPPTKTCCYAYSCMCTYEHYLLCRYPHVELLAPGVCVSSTLQDATSFPKQFYSLYFHPAVYENSSCDVSIPLPGLKTLLSWFSKTLQAIKSNAFLF